MSQQWLRKASLVVAVGEQGLDISNLAFTFKLKQFDIQTPNNITVRVYNTSDDTANQVQKEFTRVILQAGYETGPYGLLFDGTIVQVRRGHESAIDSYLDIIGADGDEASNFAVVNTSIAAGSTFKDRATALTNAMTPHGVTTGHTDPLPTQTLPRGRVFYGMAKDHLRDLAASSNTKWSIQNGQLNIVALDGYLPGEAVVLTSATGLIGFPEQTQDGIKIRCLLNPQIKAGSQVQVDNKSVQQATLALNVQGAAQNAFLPSIADDGFYRVVMVEHSGGTRTNDWYSDLTCVAIGAPVTPSLLARGYS